MRRASALVALLAPLALGGCLTPVSKPPRQAAVHSPAGWRTDLGPGAPVAQQWWRSFGDPALDALVEAALRDNDDLAIAATRIAEARAQQRIARAALVPNLDTATTGGRAQVVGPFGTPLLQSYVEPQLNVSYELDLFGRNSDLARAATLDARTAEATRNAQALSIVATTVRSYVTLLALDARLATARGTLAARTESLRVARRRAETGYTSMLELRQAESEYRATAAIVPQVEAQISQQEDALKVLTGDVPGPVARGRSLADIAVPPIPDGLPTEVLRRRPDIAASEAAIAAADARLAAARAAFLPQFPLTGSAGLFASSIIPSPFALWSLGGSVLAPIFEGGRLRGQQEAATAQRDRAAFEYRRTALNAFREVEDGLALVSRLGEQIRETSAQRAALAEALRLARNRYRAGYASYIEQLDAQRGLLSADLTLIQVESDRLTALVTLYQAMGGAPPMPGAPPA